MGERCRAESHCTNLTVNPREKMKSCANRNTPLTGDTLVEWTQDGMEGWARQEAVRIRWINNWSSVLYLTVQQTSEKSHSAACVCVLCSQCQNMSFKVQLSEQNCSFLVNTHLFPRSAGVNGTLMQPLTCRFNLQPQVTWTTPFAPLKMKTQISLKSNCETLFSFCAVVRPALCYFWFVVK